MQVLIDPANEKHIKRLAEEYRRSKGRRKSFNAIGNELIRDGVAANGRGDKLLPIKIKQLCQKTI